VFAETEGEAPADTVYTVPGIVVEAPRIPVEIDDVYHRPGFVAVLDVGERRDRVEDLSTVLSRMVGIRVRQYGGLGSFATVSIRGSSANHVDVYLDGVPLNDGYMGLTNLGDLPLDGIARVEVFRGYAPPQLGSSSIGGTINLVTEDDGRWTGRSPIPKLEAQQSFGSYDTSRLAVSLWSQFPRVKLFLHGGRLQSQGDFEFVDDKTTPLNPADDQVTTRLNNDFESWNLLGRVDSDFESFGDVSLSYNTLFREQGVPGVGSFQSQTARSERSSHLAHLQITPRDFYSGLLQTFAGGFYSITNEQFHDPKGEITLVPQDTDNTFESHGGSLRAKLSMRRLPVSVEGLYRVVDERFHPKSNLPEPSQGPHRNRTTQTATLAGDLFLFSQNVVLTASERFLWQTTEFHDPRSFVWLPPSPQGETSARAQTPQLGFRWHPRQSITFKGNWGRSFRQPTMLELFGNTGSVTGSADLEPEEGLNRDIGAILSLESWWGIRSVFLELVYLDNRIDNLILFFPNSQFTSRPTNIGSAQIRGWEVSFASLLWNRLRFAGNYTRLESKDTGPIPYYHGNQLPGRPRNEAALFFDYSFRRWDVTYEFQWIGKNYLDPANLRPVPAREIHNLALRLNLFAGRVSVTAQSQNLTNDRIRDVNGFPLPGRSFYITARFQTKE
jgi:iron complex outermembrane receptor protein